MMIIVLRLHTGYGEKVSLVTPLRAIRVGLGAVSSTIQAGEKKTIRAGCEQYVLKFGGGYLIGWIVNMGRVRLALTIFKLKVTRRILAVFLRIHIWHELRNQRKVQPSHKTGQRTREEIREVVRRVKKRK